MPWSFIAASDSRNLLPQRLALALLGVLSSACPEVEVEDGGTTVTIHYECWDHEQAEDFDRELLEDGTFVDDVDDLRCRLEACEERPSASAIDIAFASLLVEDDAVVAVFDLVDLPDKLPFNQSGLRDYRTEYEWTAVVDVDADGFDDFKLSARHYKHEGAAQDRQAPESFVTASFLTRDLDAYQGSDDYYLGTSNATIERTDSRLVLRVATHWHQYLRAVDEHSLVVFRTTQSGPGWTCEDVL